MTYQKNKISVSIVSGLMNFFMRLQQWPTKLVPPPFRLIQMGSAFWQSRALAVAARLDIATLLADDVLDVEDIARRASSHPEATYRLLRFLASMDVFEETSARQFKNNKLSASLRDDKPNSVRAMILMHNSPEMSAPWYEALEHGVTSGEVPFEVVHKQTFFDYMSTNSDFNALFSRAMDSVEALGGDSFASDFDWQRFERIIDVGGSQGSKSLSIIKRHPHMQALVVDLEDVIKGAAEYWKDKVDHAVLSRMDFKAGNVLDAVPPANNDKDIYLLSAVLHGFDDADCIKALTNIKLAIKDTGARIAILEFVLPVVKTDMASASFDMQMMMATRGRERTRDEWGEVFAKSGLISEAVIKLRTFGCIQVLHV